MIGLGRYEATHLKMNLHVSFGSSMIASVHAVYVKLNKVTFNGCRIMMRRATTSVHGCQSWPKCLTAPR